MGFPRAIAHVDADAFFASVEQAMHPEYRGRPVVTGQERNIVSAASYEAKAKGVKRGVALWDVKKICPDCIILPSDYETYSLYSLRLFEILRRYTPDVEEYSIDEAFLDLTGVARLHRKGYRAVISEIQRTVERELGIGVSIGLSLTRTLAKIASRLRKPRGLVAVSESRIPDLLERTPVEAVCGIGPKSAALLAKFGVATTKHLTDLSEASVRRLLGRPGVELWLELQGALVNPVVAGSRSPEHSVMKSKTFTPPSSDRVFVRAQCLRNLESACIKLRRHSLDADRVQLHLRRQDFRYDGEEARLEQRTNLPPEILPVLNGLFDSLFRSGRLYRATGVVLAGLAPTGPLQVSLFGDAERSEKGRALYDEIGGLAEKYGKHVVSAGTGLFLKRSAVTSRAALPERKTDLLPGETRRRRLAVPLWDVKL